MAWKVVPGAAKDQSSRTTGPQTQSKETLIHGKQARVLVVDDEPSICKALSMAFSRAGYDVIAALSGESALAIVRNEHVDVMLIDLRIPDMRGDVIFEVAASHQPHLRYQTLFMTGDITDRVEALVGACKCDFLRKPFDLRDLMAAVAALTPRVHDAAG